MYLKTMVKNADPIYCSNFNEIKFWNHFAFYRKIIACSRTFYLNILQFLVPTKYIQNGLLTFRTILIFIAQGANIK